MARFATRAFIYTLVATILWWIAYAPLAAATIALAKFLQNMVGAPTPYLLIEVMDYWWLAPPVQLFVGLTLASYWIPWRRRIAILLYGLLLLTFIVAMNILVVSSPYLGPTSARYVVGLLLTKSHLIVSPLILWLILCELPTQSLPSETASSSAIASSQRKNKNRGASAHLSRDNSNDCLAASRWWPRALVALALCLTLPLTLCVLAAIAPMSVQDARKDLMAALQTGDDRRSIVRAALLGKAQQQIYAGREDQNIHYLLGRLCLRVGDFATARIHLTNASIQPQARARIEEELLSLLPQTNAVSPGITSRPTPQSSPNTAYKSPSE